jgi:hypothetical protein
MQASGGFDEDTLAVSEWQAGFGYYGYHGMISTKGDIAYDQAGSSSGGCGLMVGLT